MAKINKVDSAVQKLRDKKIALNKKHTDAEKKYVADIKALDKRIADAEKKAAAKKTVVKKTTTRVAAKPLLPK